jgi:hypothetical protein
MEINKEKTMKEYLWEVISSGFIEAKSLEKAKKEVKENADSLVNDDYKYWEIKVHNDYDEEEV